MTSFHHLLYNFTCKEKNSISTCAFVLILLLYLTICSDVVLNSEINMFKLIKNVHFILGSVKVADLSGHPLHLHEAAPSINYHDMLCSLCKRSMLFCVCFSNSLFLRQNFSRSPYLDNHLSESTHTWTIGTLYGWLSFHDIGPQSPCPCSTCDISVSMFSRSPYIDNNLSETIHT